MFEVCKIDWFLYTLLQLNSLKTGKRAKRIWWISNINCCIWSWMLHWTCQWNRVGSSIVSRCLLSIQIIFKGLWLKRPSWTDAYWVSKLFVQASIVNRSMLSIQVIGKGLCSEPPSWADAWCSLIYVGNP